MQHDCDRWDVPGCTGGHDFEEPAVPAAGIVFTN
jgi:hypothetical protein